MTVPTFVQDFLSFNDDTEQVINKLIYMEKSTKREKKKSKKWMFFFYIFG